MSAVPPAEPPRGAGPVVGAGAGAVVLEREDPALLAANLRVGSRLFSAAVAFMFMAFVFAFLYLHALNSNGAFKPAHINPKNGYGIAILVCVLAGTAAFDFARRSLVSGREPVWRAGSSVALVLLLAGVGIQALQFSRLGFGPTDGGYASVFVGWTGLFAVVLLGAVYWVETLWAQSLRRPVATRGDDIDDPAALLRPEADAGIVFLCLLSGVEILAFVLLYIVK